MKKKKRLNGNRLTDDEKAENRRKLIRQIAKKDRNMALFMKNEFAKLGLHQ